MNKFTKALAAIMLSVAVVIAAGCTKPDDPNNGGNGGNGGGGSSNGTELPAGMYLGVIGFNQQLYTRPITRLDEATIRQTKDFIDGLDMGGATLLYHAVNTSLDMLASNGIPQDLINVSIVNFTDGLDEGSYTMNPNYNSGTEYLQAVTQRIRNEKIGTKGIGAHTIGIQGNDVESYDIPVFLNNLNGISSLPDEDFETYVHNVTSFEEVRKAFKEIAEKLHEKNTNAIMTLRPPAPDPNTRVRFAFDVTTTGPNDVLQSQKFIEGVYITNSEGKGVLTNIQYRGVDSKSGSTVTAVSMNPPFAVFEFEGMTNDDGSDFNTNTIARLSEWKYNANANVWRHNTEFTSSGNTEITNNYYSSLVMLNLDCSQSLGQDKFRLLKTYAKEFVDVLKTN